MKRVSLTVYDHATDADSDWKNLDTLKSDKTIIEVMGFIAKEDEHYYYLVQAHGEEQYSNCFRVLKSTVIKEEEFKRKLSKPRRSPVRGGEIRKQAQTEFNQGNDSVLEGKDAT